ncbi:TolC family protein [Thioalkalivibrio sp. ALM2T]|uniref:TolC family protein n=1 Tax=Thioalkalivibrio sp. ALM2T TaxID=1158184 RepID=UPI000379F987|nr:TolC family protein [Thioalkalivibrio sp. ALM2T]
MRLFKHPALFSCLLVLSTTAGADPRNPGGPDNVIAAADSAIESRMRAGSEPLRLTLRETLQLALARNPSLRGAYLGRVVDRANLDLANRAFHPRNTVTFQAREQRTSGANGLRTRTASVNPSASLALPTGARAGLNWRVERILHSDAPDTPQDSASQITLDITQPLLRGGGLEIGRAPVERAHLNEEQNVLALESQVISTLAQVIQAYRNLILENQRVELARLALERSRQELENRTELVDRGRLAAADLAPARESLARQELQQEQTQERRDQAELNLIRLVGLVPGVQIEPQDTIDVHDIDGLRADTPTLENAMDTALHRSPEFRQSLVAQRLAALDRTLAEDGNRWQLDLSASIEVRGDSPSTTRAIERGFEESPGHSLGLRLSIPWGDRHIRQQRLGVAQVEQRQARLRTRALRTSIRIEVERTLGALENRWDQLRLAEQALDLAQQAVAVEQEKLAVGRSSGFEVESVERELREAEQSLLDAAINYQNAQTDLDRAMGIVLERWDLAIPSRTTDTSAYID